MTEEDRVMKSDCEVLKADNDDEWHADGILGHWLHQVLRRKKVPVLREMGLRNGIHANAFTPAGVQESNMNLNHLPLLLMWC